MDVQALIQAISMVGFPIVCCGVVMYFLKYVMDKNREDMNTLNAMHKTEMTEMTQAINNNTLALQKLCDKLTIEVRQDG